MSRETYHDDDGEGSYGLWRGRLMSSKRSKRGRAALRELREALLALPRKRLITNRLAVDGDVCSVGALVLFRTAREVGSLGAAQTKLEAMDAWCTCKHRLTAHDERSQCPECILWASFDRRAWEDGLWPKGRWIHEPGMWRSTVSGHRCRGFTLALPSADDEDDDDGDSSVTLQLAKDAGVPDTVAWWLVAQNDDRDFGYGDLTPEQRYEAVLGEIEGDLRAMGEVLA